jgi:hypothetical protein
MRKGLLAVSALLTVTLSACAREHGEGGALAPGLTGDDPAFGPASTGQARDGGAPVAPSDAGPFVLPPLADAAAPDARAVDPRFADAVPIAGRALVDITEPEQTNHFTFDGAAGDYYELRTTRHTFSPDVAITLYDEAGTLLAQNDDGALWPGDAVDARLVVRLPRTGRYVVEVHDPSTPADFFGGGFALRYYTLSVQAVEAGTPGFRRADEGAATFVTDPESGYAYATVLGELRAGVELR